MSKKYTASEVKAILKEVMGRGFLNLDYLVKELRKLDVKTEEFAASEKEDAPQELIERVNVARGIISTMTLVNDILAPGHQISLHLFPQDAKNFIAQCILQQEQAKKYELIEKERPKVEDILGPNVQDVQ